ncbi:hypothetical protein K8I28_15365 [bacterium]|nr:hypothetical protein [bacterium]
MQPLVYVPTNNELHKKNNGELKMNLVQKLSEASVTLGVEDINKLRSAAKRLNCYGKVAGAEFVDVDEFRAKSVEQTQERKERRASSTPGKKKSGSQIGIVKGRIAQYPKWISKKQSEISKKEIELKSAQTPYDQSKLKNDLAGLKLGLRKLETRKEQDEKLLDQILQAELTQYQQATTEDDEAGPKDSSDIEN